MDTEGRESESRRTDETERVERKNHNARRRFRSVCRRSTHGHRQQQNDHVGQHAERRHRLVQHKDVDGAALTEARHSLMRGLHASHTGVHCIIVAWNMCTTNKSRASRSESVLFAGVIRGRGQTGLQVIKRLR